MATDLNRLIQTAAQAVVDNQSSKPERQKGKRQKPRLPASAAFLIGAGAVTAGRLIAASRGNGLLENVQQRLVEFEERHLGDQAGQAEDAFDDSFEDEEPEDEYEDEEPEDEEPQDEYDEDEPEEEEPEGEYDEDEPADEEPEDEYDEDEPEEEEPEGELEEEEPEGEYEDEDADDEEGEDERPRGRQKARSGGRRGS